MGILLWLLLAAGLIVVASFAHSFLEGRKLDAAHAEYRELYIEHGSKAQEHCPHRIIQFGQTGIPGVVTMTTKWCRICGKHLGPARLRESIFGNRWQ